MRRFAVVVLGQALQKMRDLKKSPSAYPILKAWIAELQERGLPLSPETQRVCALPTNYILICEVALDHVTHVVDISVYRIEEE